jgi:hypothetical protein
MFREQIIRPVVKHQRTARRQAKQRVIKRDYGVSAFDMLDGNGSGDATAKGQSDLLWMHLETKLLLELGHTIRCTSDIMCPS